MRDPSGCLQETYAPENTCFGCSPTNERGLRIRSFPQGDEVVAVWRPEPHHEAFPGVLNGGILGALLDCHCNLTAAWHIMRRSRTEKPPCTVTAEYAVKLNRPTPSSEPVRLVSRVVESTGRKVVVEAELSSGGKVCATCRGTFIAVTEGHPAYHRW